MNSYIKGANGLPTLLHLKKGGLVLRQSIFGAAVLAAVAGVCAFSPAASAAAISIVGQDTTTLPSDFVTTPDSSKGSFSLSVKGTDPNSRVSPFGNSNEYYSAISANGKPGEATYNLHGATTFSFLWGSPDDYNKVAFFSGPNHTGKLLAVFDGNDLTAATPGAGFDFVSFAAASGVQIGSVVLFDKTGQAAFEFSDVDPPSPTPLPAALPLYAAGIGVMALLGWRRKRTQGSAALA